MNSPAYPQTRHSRQDRFSAIKHLLALLPWGIFIYTGLVGIDFGYHWDEKFQFALVQQTLETTTLLPGWYQYPSVSYWLSLAGLLPHLLSAARTVGGDWHALLDHLQLVLGTPAYHLQLRALFLFISSLSIPWTYLAVWRWRRNWFEALAAAAFLAFSWEIAYHARWIAPDGVLMQFGALTLLGLSAATSLASESTSDDRRPRARRWLALAGMAAGLGCGSKYPGGLLIVPCLICAWQLHNGSRPFNRLICSARDILPWFILAYLASTPGTVLDPLRFYKDLRYEFTHYTAGQYDQTVTPGLPHLGLILTYLSRVLFSHYQPIALVIFLLALLGASQVFRDTPAVGVLLTSFPLLYVTYFSLQQVMAARNLLVLAPFLAILAGRGAHFAAESLAARWGRPTWIAGLCIIMAINAVWLNTAAQSIRHRSAHVYLNALLHYAAKLPPSTLEVSDRLWSELTSLGETLPASLTREADAASRQVAFYASEGMANPLDWPANLPGLADRVFGPWEVNFDYYPLWAGDDRILVLSIEKARQIGVQVVR